MSDYQRHFPDFVEAVRARLAKGAVEYGNRSFSKEPAELLEELRQEALDLAGWGFVLYCRLQAMSDASRNVTKCHALSHDVTPRLVGVGRDE